MCIRDRFGPLRSTAVRRPIARVVKIMIVEPAIGLFLAAMPSTPPGSEIVLCAVFFSAPAGQQCCDKQYQGQHEMYYNPFNIMPEIKPDPQDDEYQPCQ